MPLLTIITRTFNARPLGLAANVASVDRQIARQEIEHLVVVDELRRGVAWAQENLRTVQPRGDYVMLLDDDDFLLGDGLIPGLTRQVALAPEVVIVQMNMGDGRILPSDAGWGNFPQRSGIPCSSYIVRRDVWNEHVSDFAPRYDGDYDFIEAIYNCGHPLLWWKSIVSRVGQVSHGEAENGSLNPVGLSSR
jgi:glycosyltransferase involved in cell wall biosynthesis